MRDSKSEGEGAPPKRSLITSKSSSNRCLMDSKKMIAIQVQDLDGVNLGPKELPKPKDGDQAALLKPAVKAKLSIKNSSMKDQQTKHRDSTSRFQSAEKVKGHQKFSSRLLIGDLKLS